MRASIPPRRGNPPVASALNERENQRVRRRGARFFHSLLGDSNRHLSERRSGRTTKRASERWGGRAHSFHRHRRCLLMVPYAAYVRQFASGQLQLVMLARATDGRREGGRDGQVILARLCLSVCLSDAFFPSFLCFRALWRHIARSANSRPSRPRARPPPWVGRLFP